MPRPTPCRCLAPWALLGLLAAPAAAANLSVTHTADSGAGSLRAALQTAESNGEDDLITITATGTITLLSPLPTLSTTMALNGPGAALLTVSGDGARRVLRIAGGTIAVTGLTIANGLARGEDGGDGLVNLGGGGGGGGGFGGGVYIAAGTVSFSGVAFTGNVARGGDGGNGAPRPPATGTNQGGDGGASSLGAAGGGSVPSGGAGGSGGGGGGGRTAGGNGVAGNAGGGGGQGGSALTTFGGGSGGSGGGCGGGSAAAGLAGEFGGRGGWTSGGPIGNQNCFTGAGGGGGAGLGGAIHLESGMLTLTNVTFSGNQAIGGAKGGDFNGDDTSTPSNAGLGKGGALFVDTAGTVVPTNVTFSGNLATDDLGICTDDDDLYSRGAFPLDPPTALALSPLSVPELAPIGTAVGTFTTTDASAVDFHTYTLVAGAGSTHNAQFAIVGDELRTNAVFDHETQPTRSVRVRTTDQCGQFFEAPFTITITNVNEPPVVTAAAFSVAESSPAGTVVGTVTAADPDAGTVLTWSIQSGNVGGAFAIAPATGQITVAGPLDFETLASYSLLVRATDNGAPVLFGEATVTITITDVDEPPVANGDAYATDEDTPLTIPPPGVLANDADPEQTALAVTGADGQSAFGALVAVTADGGFTYDPRPSGTLQALGAGDQVVDSFTYTVSDAGGQSAVGTVTVTVDGTAVGISLVKEALVPGGQVPLGSTFAFRLTVANDPTGLASGVVVADPLPAGLTFAGSACATEAAGQVTWDLGDVAAGGTASCDFLVTPVATGTFVNVAALASVDLPPGAEPTAEATVRVIFVAEIPALGGFGRWLLAAGLGVAALLAQRRRARRSSSAR